MGNILIIEDNKIFADDIAFFVEDEGHKCTVYNSTDQVIKNWDSVGKFDVIILDLMMRIENLLQPNDDEVNLDTGEILFNKILAGFPNKRIIIVTAKTPDEIEIDTKQKNVQVINKPFNDEKIKLLLDLLG